MTYSKITLVIVQYEKQFIFFFERYTGKDKASVNRLNIFVPYIHSKESDQSFCNPSRCNRNFGYSCLHLAKITPRSIISINKDKISR